MSTEQLSEKELLKQKSFEEAAKPLMKWLNENANPHSTVIVTPTNAELLSGEMCIYTEQFLED